MINQLELQINNLMNDIEVRFPAPDEHPDDKSKTMLPFCVNLGYEKIIANLSKLEPKETSKTRVAIFGNESSLLSMAPVLLNLADVVFFTNPAPWLRAHFQFLLECLENSNEPAQFIINYQRNIGKIIDQIPDDLFEPSAEKEEVLLSLIADKEKGWPWISAGRYYFLSNLQNYSECKYAVNKLKVGEINLNLTHVGQCQEFNKLLLDNNACLTLCNAVPLYSQPRTKIEQSLNELLKNNECLLMYPILHNAGLGTHLRTMCSLAAPHNIPEFDTIGTSLTELKKLNFKQKSAIYEFGNNKNSLFHYLDRKKNSSDQVCYVAILSSYPEHIQEILDGKNNLNNYSTKLHAFDTLNEVRAFAEKQITDKDKKCWIFTIRGTQEEINPMLRYLGIADPGYPTQIHFPYDYMGAGLKLSSRLIEATDYDNNVVLTKHPVHSNPPLRRI